MNATGADWSIGGDSIRGQAHVRKGLNNQDAIKWAPPSGVGETAVIAVSDGHGAKEHSRSDIGSRLAVDAAVAVLSDFLGQFKAGEIFAVTAASLEIPLRIHKAWRAAVEADLKQTPLRTAGATEPESHLVPYGATLLAIAAAPGFALLVQIGDGDIVVGLSDGTLKRPLPDDAGLVGEQTHSLCDPEAAKGKFFRLQVLPVVDGGGAQPEFLMLSTDGLSKSCPDDQAFMKLAADWRTSVRKGGLAPVTQSLKPWLEQASARGSGDDISLGFAVRSAAAIPAVAALPDHRVASMQCQIQLATRVSSVALVASVLSLLLIATMLLWPTPKVPPSPQAHKPSPVVQSPAAKPTPPVRQRRAKPGPPPRGGASFPPQGSPPASGPSASEVTPQQLQPQSEMPAEMGKPSGKLNSDTGP